MKPAPGVEKRRPRGQHSSALPFTRHTPESSGVSPTSRSKTMLAPRFRGAFVLGAVGLLVAACSNGTEPKQSLCDASNPVTLAVGEVRTPISDACVFVSSGSSNGEYALVPFNADTIYTRTSSLSFTSSGVTAVSTPLQTR